MGTKKPRRTSQSGPVALLMAWLASRPRKPERPAGHRDPGNGEATRGQNEERDGQRQPDGGPEVKINPEQKPERHSGEPDARQRGPGQSPIERQGDKQQIQRD